MNSRMVLANARAGLTITLLALACAMPGACSAAASTGEGLTLRWDRCFADGGGANRDFACNTNSGTERLVLGFVLSAPQDSLNGVKFILDFGSTEPSLPAWWQFKNSGTCRFSSLGIDFAMPVGTVQCQDWSAGTMSGGIGSYTIPFWNTNQDRIDLIGVSAVPPANLAHVDAGVEYVIATITINHAKTVGTNACAGCQTPVCIAASYAKLTHPVAAQDHRVTGEGSGPGSDRVTWQQAAIVTPQLICDNTRCWYDFICTSSTPTSRSTWGAVKALYR